MRIKVKDAKRNKLSKDRNRYKAERQMARRQKQQRFRLQGGVA